MLFLDEDRARVYRSLFNDYSYEYQETTSNGITSFIGHIIPRVLSEDIAEIIRDLVVIHRQKYSVG
jgi:hypothetical protein